MLPCPGQLANGLYLLLEAESSAAIVCGAAGFPK